MVNNPDLKKKQLPGHTGLDVSNGPWLIISMVIMVHGCITIINHGPLLNIDNGSWLIMVIKW